MSDHRLGISIEARDVNASTEIAALNRQIVSLQATLRSASQMGLTPANNAGIAGISREIEGLEAKVKALQAALSQIPAAFAKLPTNALPAGYSQIVQSAARGAEELAAAQLKLASIVAPQQNIAAYRREVEAQQLALSKLSQEQARFSSVVAPQSNIAARRREEARITREAQVALDAYVAAENKAEVEAARFASQIAPQTRIRFVTDDGQLKAIPRELRDIAQESDSASIAARRLVSLFDEGARGQRGAMMSTIGASLRDITGNSNAAVVGLGALVAVASGAALVRGAENLGKWAEQTKAAAAATGTSVEAYSRLQGALVLTGAKAEAADSSLRIFARNISEAVGDPASRAAQAFRAIGISIDELKESGGDTVAVFMKVADAFQHLGQDSANATNLAAVASELLGRSVENMAHVLPMGSSGIRDLGDQAAKLGHTLNDETADALSETGIKARTLGETISGNATKAFEAWQPEIRGVIGLLQSLIDVLGSATSALGRFINEAIEAGPAAQKEMLSAGYIADFATGQLEAVNPGAQQGRLKSMYSGWGTSPREGRPFGGPRDTSNVPSVPAIGSQVSAYEQLQERMREAQLNATAAGGSSQAMRQNSLKAEIATLQEGLQSTELNEKQKLEIRAQIAEKSAELNEQVASSGEQAAKKSYSAFAQEEQNKLSAARGNVDAQRAILAEWTAEAQRQFSTQSADYRRAMAEIQKAAQQVQVQIASENLAATRSALNASREEYRIFADDISAMVKLKVITPSQGTGFDIQRATQLGQQDISRVQGLYTGDMTQQQSQQVDQLLEHTKLGWEVTLADLQKDSGTAFQNMAKEAEKAFENAFSRIGSGLERFVTEGITKSTTFGKAGKQLFESVVSGGVGLVGDVLSKGGAALLGAKGGEGIGELLSSKLFSLLGLGGQGEQAAQTAATTANTAALTALTSALAGTAAATGGSAVAGAGAAAGGSGFFGWLGGLFSGAFEHGGIVPSAAGGMITPSGGAASLALLHPREMVLPANVTSHILNSMDSASRGNSSFVYAPTLNGSAPFTTRGEAEMFFQRHGAQMEQMARSAMRNRWRA